MLNNKKRSQNYKSHQKNYNIKSNVNYKGIKEQDLKKNKYMMKRTNKSKKANKSNSSSNNSSLSKKKEKSDIKIIESEIKKERKIDE